MPAKRSWSWILSGLIVCSTLALHACTQSEPEKTEQPASAPSAAAPAAPAPGQPAQAPAPGATMSMVIDELYVDAEADPDEGAPPLTVKFTSTVEDATGAVTCTWDFGDGTPASNDMNPTHVYQAEGDYVVTLKCKDSKGIEGETEIDVSVYTEE
ncbi:MAG TPA: PKD domain-containing protein [Candidatus Binatia bacterium]